MKKVLVIEDEKILYEVVENALRKRGYEVEIAEDGRIGLEKMREQKYDLVLLDIVMPNMDGVQLLEQAQKEEGLASMPIVVISNSGRPEELEKAKQLGATDWLLKTKFDPQEVVDKVVDNIGEPA